MGMLTQLELAYRQTATELALHPEQIAILRPFSGFFTRLLTVAFAAATATGSRQMPSPVRALRLAESIADMEYAVKTHENFRRWFSRWLKFHIVVSVVLYGLLGLHVWSGIHFGLRWFE